MISVIIPLYNKESCILRTMRSVLAQTYSDFELIVVNDGSTDKSFLEAKKLIDSRIRLIDKENGGVSSARNAGIIAAQSEYIAFIDADDIWLPDHLATISEMIEKHSTQALIFATSIAKISNLEEVKTRENTSSNFLLIDDYFQLASKPITTITSSSFAVKKEAAISAGLFNEKLHYGEDVEFWHKVMKNGKLSKSDRVTAYYFTGAQNRSDSRIIPLDKRYHVCSCFLLGGSSFKSP